MSQAAGILPATSVPIIRTTPTPIRHSIVRSLLLGFLVLVALVVVFVVVARPTSLEIETTYYQMADLRIETPLRIVVIADFHSSNYGPDAAELAGAVAELRPDLVVYAGDTFDLREPPEFAVAAISALAHYPSFAILGNHDFLDTAHNIAVFQEHGVPVLRGECEEFFGILICGVDDPVSRFSRRYPEQVADVSLQAESYSGFTFLIAHRPERFADYTAFDLAVTGHAHGGQWRLPGVLTQGLYAPHQGIFPSHTSGQFGNMIVSRGLARHTPIDNSVVTVPRIFNRPELVVIDLLPEIYVG